MYVRLFINLYTRHALTEYKLYKQKKCVHVYGYSYEKQKEISKNGYSIFYVLSIYPFPSFPPPPSPTPYSPFPKQRGNPVRLHLQKLIYREIQ